MPKADYDAIDGMDERYFLHVEDIDFCLRFRKSGGEVYFNPHVAVTHYKSSSRANAVRIEARKTAGVVRYFNTHFSDAYPKAIPVACRRRLMWASFGALVARRAGRQGAAACRIAQARRRARAQTCSGYFRPPICALSAATAIERAAPGGI